MITQAAVHTSGINWESVSTIIGTFCALTTLILLVIRSISKSIRGEIKESIDHLAEVLEAKLETKDKVNEIAKDVAVLKKAEEMRKSGRTR